MRTARGTGHALSGRITRTTTGGAVNKVLKLALVTAFAFVSVAVRGADITAPEERAELRQRADAYQSERARNRDFQPGEGRLPPGERGEAPPKHKNPHAKSGTKPKPKATHKTSASKTDKAVSSLKKIPGAFVR